MTKTTSIIAALCITASWTFSSIPPSLQADSSFTTQDLAQAALSTDCLDWKIDGICFWLRCGLFGCRVVTSPRVSHRLPDLVVQSYIEPGNPPWREWRPHTQTAANTALLGSRLGTGMTGATNRNRFSHMLNYFEADVAGNPVADLYGRIPGRFLCRSDVTPFHPYLSAPADAVAWRSTGVEDNHLDQDNGQLEVGLSADNTWGPIHPRTGFVLQPHPAKAAAVTAARGIDIVTRDIGDHVATPLQTERKFPHKASRRPPMPRIPDPAQIPAVSGARQKMRAVAKQPSGDNGARHPPAIAADGRC